MSHGTEDVLRQLRAGEDSAWEFMQVEFTGNRPVRPSRDDWADEIAAFANARGGVLLCGVTDDGEAQGMSREQIVALDALLVEIGTDSIKPAVRIHTWHRMLPEGERVLLLEVPESDSQHDSSGVHRDYSIRASRIRLSMFSDRIEIQSPGALPNNLTVDDMPHRQATRNELLTSLLGRVSAAGIKGAGGRLFVIERRGDGVPIMRRETRELSGKLPEFRLIAGSELCVSIPAASLEFSPARAVVTVRCGDRPLPGVELLVLFPNKTWKRAITDENGEAGVDLHTTALPMTVFAAAPGYSAHLERAWTPSRGTLALGLHELRWRRMPLGASLFKIYNFNNFDQLRNFLSVNSRSTCPPSHLPRGDRRASGAQRQAESHPRQP